MQYAQIAVNTKTSLDRQTFTYKIKPEHLPYVRPGVLVSVPFHGRDMEGMILSFKHLNNIAFKQKLKFINKIIDSNPLLDEKGLELAKWISNYYLAPIGDVIFMMIPPIARRLTSSTQIAASKSYHKSTRVKNTYTLYDRIYNRLKIYVSLIGKAIKSNKSSLVLFPKIQAESDCIEYLIKYFKDKNIAILHGNLTHTQRYKIWQEIQENKYQIIIGSRSAIFAPCQNLGLIIIDEPEDFGYKEEQSPHYNAIDTAIRISWTQDANLVLGSVTPDINSYYNLSKKNYKNLKKSETGIKLPKPNYQIVDMGNEKKIISNILENEIKTHFESKQKILLMVNRKGSGAVYKCSDCQEIIKCSRCNVPLIFYENSNTLRCVHCKINILPPKTCPICKSVALRPLGIGTQTVEKEIKKLFPKIKTIIIEKEFKNDTSHIELKDYDCVIATQKILDFNYQFNLTSVIQIDNQFNIPDFKSEENMYLFLTKLINITKDKFVIQTHNPDNFIINNIKNTTKILNYILSEREKYSYPPYTKLIKLTYKDTSESKCLDAATKLYNILNNQLSTDNFQLLGPNPSFIPKKRDKYYYQIILKYPPGQDNILKNTLRQIKELSRWSVDVDPISLI